MSAIVYFSKINFKNMKEVINNEVKLVDVLQLIFQGMDDDVTYIQENEYVGSEEELKKYNITYKLNQIIKGGTKFPNSLFGYLLKHHVIFRKKFNDKGDIIKEPIDNVEAIAFYFDVKKEKVAFYTTNRFGYEQFNLAFEGVINEVLKEYGFEFEVNTITDTINIDEIVNELNKIGRIKELKIDIKIPNPGDDEVEKIIGKQDGIIDKYNDAGIYKKSVIFKSFRKESIDIKADLVMDEIKKIGELSDQIPPEKAVENGYAEIDAVGEDGKFSTKERPLKRIIDDEQKELHEFALAAYDFMNLSRWG